MLDSCQSSSPRSDWSEVDYRPASGLLFARALVPYTRPGQTVVEVGCGKGANTVLLAKAGLDVVACDVNPVMVAVAARRAQRHGVLDRIRFIVGDFTQTADIPSRADVVVMVRFLTCLYEQSAWQAALDRAARILEQSGLLFVRDFLLDEAHYGPRYAAAKKDGLPYGSFRTRASGIDLIVRHHRDEEVAALAAPYDILGLQRQKGVSMGGNPCSLFCFIGRRRSAGEK